MENWKEQFEQYLPKIEEFLTTLLLEETRIEIVTSDYDEEESTFSRLNDTDIILYSRDEANHTDTIIVLGKEWYGLLSSIMIGIEEKEKNETTIELLQEFHNDLSDVLAESLQEDGIEPELSKIQVLTKEEMQELARHEKYYRIEMAIEGVADDKVRAEFLLGDPETEIELEEEPEEEDTEEDEGKFSRVISSVANEDEAKTEAEGSEGDAKKGKNEKVISARHIEFAEFDDEERYDEGEANSMDLLKDVELNVSVELGRIELPLGKVLQLAKGSVVELEKLAGEPVDILVNGNRIALGEVVVIDEHFGVRISSLVTTKKRLAKISE